MKNANFSIEIYIKFRITVPSRHHRRRISVVIITNNITILIDYCVKCKYSIFNNDKN